MPLAVFIDTRKTVPVEAYYPLISSLRRHNLSPQVFTQFLRPEMEIGWQICRPDIWAFAFQSQVLQGWLKDLTGNDTHYVAFGPL